MAGGAARCRRSNCCCLTPGLAVREVATKAEYKARTSRSERRRRRGWPSGRVEADVNIWATRPTPSPAGMLSDTTQYIVAYRQRSSGVVFDAARASRISNVYDVPHTPTSLKSTCCTCNGRSSFTRPPTHWIATMTVRQRNMGMIQGWTLRYFQVGTEKENRPVLGRQVDRCCIANAAVLAMILLGVDKLTALT